MTCLEFFTTEGCHLCEEAEKILQLLISEKHVSVEVIDISSSEELVELYGIRLPVVRNASLNKEVGWPFAYEQLLTLIP